LNVDNTTINDDDDDDDDDDESLSLHVGKLQASLAEESATEMERIVQETPHDKLKQDLDGDDARQILSSIFNPTNTTAHTKEQSTPPSCSPHSVATTTTTTTTTTKTIHRWVFRLVLISMLLSALLVYQWLYSRSDTKTVIMSRKGGSPTMHEHQTTYTRQVCRTLHDGRRYCESEQESSDDVVGSSHHYTGSDQQQHQVYYQRQQCQYSNGESYCESYEELQSVSGLGTQEQAASSKHS